MPLPLPPPLLNLCMTVPNVLLSAVLYAPEPVQDLNWLETA